MGFLKLRKPMLSQIEKAHRGHCRGRNAATAVITTARSRHAAAADGLPPSGVGGG